MGMILPKDALTESDNKAWYAYTLKKYEQEFQQYIELVTRRYYKTYKNFAKNLLLKDKNYLEALTKFLGETRKKENS